MSEAAPIPDSQPRPVPPVEGFAPGPISAWIAWGTRTLEGATPSPSVDAEVLMAAQLGVERSQLRSRDEDPTPAALALQYAAVVERRRMGEPVAYITGRQGFWSLELDVEPCVLIPRADTETLVEWALECVCRDGPRPRIADLGTGTGAIALALAKELPNARVVASDCSEAALAVARRNARGAALDHVEFRCGDWYEALGAERYDLIASNPPYIAEGDPHLPALRYEPRLALTSGADGLNAIRRIVSDAPAHLESGGWLLIEHGHDQGGAVRALFAQSGFRDIETRRDFGGNERVTGGARP